ncbi:MAG: GDSL-type esterase/lipase family protein [Chthoniobacteraceae bacterium]
MKLPIVLSTWVLFAAGAMAQNAPDVWPMPSPLPALAQGANPAAVPFPRMDWFQRIINTNAKAQASAGQIELIFDGDSITDNWRGPGKEVWQKYYGNRNAFDFGIGGDRTEHVLWRLSQGQVNNLHPKLVALMIGTNNTGGNSAEQIAEGIKAIVTDYQKRCPETVILLQAVFPRGEKADNPVRAKIKQINEIISSLGDGKKVIYVDFGDKFLQPDGTLSRDIMPDFLHPNAAGYEIWANAIAPIVEKYVPAK